MQATDLPQPASERDCIHHAVPVRRLPTRVRWPRDRAAVRAHFAALSGDDLRLRFGHPASSVSVADYLRRLEATGAPAFAFVEADGQMSAFGHFGIGTHVLELGLSVLPAFRRRRYATALLRRARVHARARGLAWLEMHSVEDNHAIVALARRHRMTIVTEGGATESRIRLRAATSADGWRDRWLDAAADWQAFVRRVRA